MVAVAIVLGEDIGPLIPALAGHEKLTACAVIIGFGLLQWRGVRVGDPVEQRPPRRRVGGVGLDRRGHHRGFLHPPPPVSPVPLVALLLLGCAANAQSDARILHAIGQVEGGERGQRGDGGAALGLYQMHPEAWADGNAQLLREGLPPPCEIRLARIQPQPMPRLSPHAKVHMRVGLVVMQHHHPGVVGELALGKLSGRLMNDRC